MSSLSTNKAEEKKSATVEEKSTKKSQKRPKNGKITANIGLWLWKIRQIFCSLSANLMGSNRNLEMGNLSTYKSKKEKAATTQKTKAKKRPKKRPPKGQNRLNIWKISPKKRFHLRRKKAQKGQATAKKSQNRLNFWKNKTKRKICAAGKKVPENE